MRKAVGEAAASAGGVPDSKQRVATEAREDAAFLQWNIGEGAALLAADILEDATRSSTGAAGPTTQQGGPPSSLISIVDLCRRSGSKAVISTCVGPKTSPFAETETRSFEVSAVEAGGSTGATVVFSEKGDGGRASAAARYGDVSPSSGSELLVSAVLKSLALLVGADTARVGPPPNTAEISAIPSWGDPGHEVRPRVDHYQTDRSLLWKTPTSICKATDSIGPGAVPSDQHRDSLSLPLPLVPLDFDTMPRAVEAVDTVRVSQGVGGRFGENAQVDTDGRRRLLFRGVFKLLRELFENEKQALATEDGRKGESESAGAGAGCRLRASGQQGTNGVWVSAGARRYPLAVLIRPGLMVFYARRLLGTRSSSFPRPRPLQPTQHSFQLILHTIQAARDLGRFSFQPMRWCWTPAYLTRFHVG